MPSIVRTVGCGLATVGLVLGILLAVGVAAAQAAFPGENGKIAFEGFVSGLSLEIYTMNPDGTDVQRLTDNTAVDRMPVWSADGSKIAFSSDRDGNYEIYAMDADGSVTTRLTNDPAFDGWPAWSPDGSKIAFSSDRDGDFDVYTMNADGSGVVNLTDSNALTDFDPDWSPNGARIAFSQQVDDEALSRDVYRIHTMDTDGKNSVRVSPFEDPTCSGLLQDDSPDWSPDGEKIAYHDVSDYDGDRCESIETVNVDGTGHLVLATAYVVGEYNGPAWSPDGSKIAFGPGIQIANPDGSGGVVVDPGVFANNPDWQPIVNHEPDCSGVAADPSVLWPPNRRLRLVELAGASDPDGDAVSLELTGVTQDERVVGGRDAVRASESAVRLRAKRDPRGDGRVYRIAFTVTDAKGAECQGTASVAVPRHKREPAIDSAPPSYDSFGH